MKAIRRLKRAFAAVALVLLLGTVNCLASDNASESFDRMLAHQPGRGTKVPVAGVDADPLIEAIVIPLREGVQRPVATAVPVAESFARMLAHAPSPIAPSVPANLGPDPLIAAMVEPLRQWLTEGAATAHFASARIPAVER